MDDERRSGPVEGGFSRWLTRFFGRQAEAHRLEGLLARHRLVTLAGPGGVGKTRLAAEVTRAQNRCFPDGVRLVELAAIRDPEQVPWAVAASLGVQDSPVQEITPSISAALSTEHSLLVLDNCEQVLDAVAQLCQSLLSGSDDIQILTTSREPVGVPGEAQLRLSPLPADPDSSGRDGEAVALFLDRVRLRDPGFAVTPHTLQQASEIVARVDGLPLAIELAAARVESMGMTPLLQRLDEPLRVLSSDARTTAPRHRSLRATADWSYQLLPEQSRRVFRRLATLPGPFTLGTALAVAGTAAESAILSLVDASILLPPRDGPDGRSRYLMLDSLRAYGREQLDSFGETGDATSARNSYALLLAEDAAALMQAPGGEASAACWFDAESALLHRALLSRLDHDHGCRQAVRLGVALAPWWRLRGLRSMGYPMLLRAVDQSCGDLAPEWRAAQKWLGRLALANSAWQLALQHFTTLHDAAERDPQATDLIDALAGRSAALRNLGRLQTAAEDAERGRDLAQAGDYTEGEALTLIQRVLAAVTAGDADTADRRHAQLREIDATWLPGGVVRQIRFVDAVMFTEAGDLNAARQGCVEGLESARTVADIAGQADFLYLITQIALLSGDIADAAFYIRESLRLTAHSGQRLRLLDCLDQSAQLCVATNRWEDAVTIWAALSAQTATLDAVEPTDRERRRAALAQARQRLRPETLHESERRGSAMTFQAAVGFASILATSPSPQAKPTPAAPGLTPREKELLILVAQGRTDAQIAESLFISIRTVRSHLDRIRDKTGYRRRADLTRLALQNGLI